MKPEIHPHYKIVKVTCSCGSTFETRSTMEKDELHLEVCSLCHPFYTGTQKLVDTAGRVDRFRQKYGMKGKDAAATVTKKVADSADATKAPVVEKKASVHAEEKKVKDATAKKAKDTEGKKAAGSEGKKGKDTDSKK